MNVCLYSADTMEIHTMQCDNRLRILPLNFSHVLSDGSHIKCWLVAVQPRPGIAERTCSQAFSYQVSPLHSTLSVTNTGTYDTYANHYYKYIN